MANGYEPRLNAAPDGKHIDGGYATIDAGLRSYMLSVYNYMASGVLLTGVVALWFANSGYTATVLGGTGILKFFLMFSPLGFVLVLSFGISRLSTGLAQMLFWAFAAVMGLSMASIFLVFTGASIASTFFATAASFAGLSLWGYTTKRDLAGFGVFLGMGLIGLLAASLINVFMQSSVLQFAISYIGVLLFAGLTAYDTQRIKNLYSEVAGTDMMGKAVIMGALSLYLDFVNIFSFLMQSLGQRR